MRTVVAVAAFDGGAREAVHALKYEGRHAIAAMMGKLMAEATDHLAIDAVAPVSLHPARRRERGYDQAVLLARALARELRVPFEGTVLKRTRRTRQQVSLRPDERRSNVAGAFSVTRPLRGETVLLVDDVYTTGATMEAAASALLEGGARAVVGAVFGHAEVADDAATSRKEHRFTRRSPLSRSTR